MQKGRLEGRGRATLAVLDDDRSARQDGDAPRAQVSATTCGKRKGSSAGTGERSNERAWVLGLKGRARGEIWAHLAQRRPKK